MGVTISGKPSSKITVRSLDMGYGGFFRLRCMAAKHLNDEFYYLYKDMLNNHSDADWEEFDECINDCIQHHKLDKTASDCKLLDFFFLPDCEGKITYGACKKLYELIKDEDDRQKIGYVGRYDCATVGDFKELLLDIYKNKGKMVWL